MPRTAQRDEGQWAVSGRAALTAGEQAKQDDDGINVRARIEQRYAREGFDAIDPGDLRQRFRWWGLYTQRRPGIDGGRTGALEEADIEDSHFMLRVRIPGGQLQAEQLRTIGEVAEEFGRGVADVTDRQNIQYHWIRIEDVPEIWRRLESVGLTTRTTCGDAPRNILGCPVAGIDADEIVDASGVLEATEAHVRTADDLTNLPRKWKSAISGCASYCTVHEINDVSFVGVRTPGGATGYDLWVGGGLSTNPMIAQRLGAFVEADLVPAVWRGVTELFRDYGYRRLRSRARLKFLLADWGTERFREVLEKEYLGGALPDGPAPPAPAAGSRDHVGVHRQIDGRCYVGVALPVGRTSGAQLADVARLAARYGSGRVRTTVEQKLLILDVPPASVSALVGELTAQDLLAEPSVFRRGTIACTGIEFCKLAIVETKARAVDLYSELERRLPGFDTPITINVNGCPNACARFQLADIGLKGSIVDGGEGFQVHLGGHLPTADGSDAAFGRKLRGLKVTTEQLPDYVERLLRTYQAHRTDGESFAAWVHRAEEGQLQ
jgi:sulfite reductase (ferredoxin)